jgi:hypothetical protein
VYEKLPLHEGEHTLGYCLSRNEMQYRNNYLLSSQLKFDFGLPHDATSSLGYQRQMVEQSVIKELECL